MSYYCEMMPGPTDRYLARRALSGALRAAASCFLHLYVFGYEKPDAARWAGWMTAAAFELEEPEHSFSFKQGDGDDYFAAPYVKRLAHDASALDQPTPSVMWAAAFAHSEDFLYLLKKSVEVCIRLAEQATELDDGYPAVILAGLRQTLAELRRLET